MSDTPHHEAHRRPHTPPKAEPFMEFDLQAEIHRLQAETTWDTGQNARTLIKYDDLRVVLSDGRSISALGVSWRLIRECLMTS